MKEYHILIAWNKAIISNEEILERLPNGVELIKLFQYSWDEKYALNNFAAFYGEKLENIQYKVNHCGAGSFRVFILLDNNPKYDFRVTSGGRRIVNTNLFDLKKLLRELTGGGHLIHGTDSEIEANLNSISLFGKGIRQLEQDNFNLIYEKHGLVNRNITGALGWNSWGEFFSALSQATRYVVIRNFDLIGLETNVAHGDTDLLVEDYEAAVTVSVARKIVRGKNRVLYGVEISGQQELIDFRHVADGYYCEVWEKSILCDASCYESNGIDIYIPNETDYKYSLLYHALVQKPYIGDDYKRILKEKFGTNEVGELRVLLNTYIEEKGYCYSTPRDASVYIHPYYYKHTNVSAVHKIIGYLKYIKYNKRFSYE